MTTRLGQHVALAPWVVSRDSEMRMMSEVPA
jgi:hypothetical protein